MSSRARKPVTGLIPLLLLAVGAVSIPALGISPIMPGDRLHRAGYSVEPADALTYLAEGLPPMEAATTPDPSYDGQTGGEGLLSRPRWELYVDAAYVLKQKPLQDAVPVLIERLTAPLPEQLLDDLLMHVALQASGSWEQWDRRIESELMKFRSACVLALFATDPQAAKAPLVELVLREYETAEAALLAQKDFSLQTRYLDLCRAAALAGAREGVDMLIALLPQTVGSHRHVIIHGSLELLSHEPPHLYLNSTEEEFREVVHAWQAWWEENRDTFTPPDPPLTPVRPQWRLETLEDYLASSARMRPGNMKPPGYEESIAWLEVHAPQHEEQIRRIAEDTSAPHDARDGAVQWYVRLKDANALPWLGEMFLSYDEEEVPWENRLRLNVLTHLLARKFPDEWRDLARESVRRNTPFAATAVGSLLAGAHDPQDRELIVQHYLPLVAQAPHLRSSLIQTYRRSPTPGDEVILEDCLINGSHSVATYAGVAVEERGIETQLSAEAQEALTRWRQDAQYRSRAHNLRQGHLRERDELALILDEVSGATAEAAKIYAQVYRELHRTPSAPEARLALERLRECIAAYRATRTLD